MKKRPQFKNNSFNFLVLVGILVLCFIAGRVVHFDQSLLKEYITRFPWAVSGAVYVGLYVFLTFFLWVSKDVLMIAGLMAFGVEGSVLWTYAAETLNAIILFGMSRKLGRDFVQEKTKGRFNDFDKRAGNIGFGDLFLLRAVILVPFRFLDLGFGLTKVSFSKYMTAVLLGSPLRIAVRQYGLFVLGSLARKDVAEIVEHIQANSDVFIWSYAYLFLVVITAYRLKKVIWG